MLESVLTIPAWFEFAACLAGSLSGAMSAIRARYDLFGTVCISIVVGLLGGVIRDILLQSYGIYAFQRPELILLCAVTGVVVFYFGHLAQRVSSLFDPAFEIVDSLTVGFWAIISVGKGLSAGLDAVPSIILGILTAVGGGIVRDVLMNREIRVFQAGSLYGSASLVGATLFALMREHHVLDDISPMLCVGVIVGIRFLSEFFDWHTTPPRDYSDKVTRIISRPARAIAKKTKPTREMTGLSMIAPKPVRKLDRTGQIARPVELSVKPLPRSTKHRDEMREDGDGDAGATSHAASDAPKAAKAAKPSGAAAIGVEHVAAKAASKPQGGSSAK